MRRSFQNLVAGTVLAATTTLLLIAPEAKATPSLGEDLEYVTNASPEACLPQFSVYFQLPERVIAIEQKDSCPVASQIYVHLANEERRFAIVAYQSRNYNNKWVSEQDPIADQGQYGVLHVEYSPGQFVSRLSQRDHRIVIVGQPHPVAPTPTLEGEPPRLPPSPRQESRSEPSQYQGKWITFDLRVFFNCLLNNPIRFNGWIVDLNPLKACLPF